MPAAEAGMSLGLARLLIESQCPDLAGLRVSPLGEGWDNWSFRVGDDLLARLPRRALAAPLIENEWKWLPQLAPRLPLTIPVPVHLGRPDFGYPFPWAIYPYIDGVPASNEPPGEPREAAITLGRFLRALHEPAPPEAPPNPFRGGPLEGIEETTSHRFSALRAEAFPGVGKLERIWTEALATSGYSGSPVWLHADFHPMNLLVEKGRLSAVVDWGDVTSGDPAVDLSVAWMLLPRQVRPALLAESGHTSETWVRARGWALSLGLAMMMTSFDNPNMESVGRRTLDALLED